MLFLNLVGSFLLVGANRLDRRVIGGKVIDAQKYKFISWVYVKDYFNFGAVRYTDNIFLTAAHRANLDTSKYTVYPELSSKVNLFKDPNAKKHKVKEIIIHPEFQRGQVLHNIAIFKVDTIGSGKTYIKLDRKSCGRKNGDPVLVIGWGFDSELLKKGHKQKDLNEAELTVINKNTCDEMYRGPFGQSNSRPVMTGREICFGELGKIKGAEERDEGGPILTTDGETLVALVSMRNCTVNRCLPTVGPRINKYIDWIDRNAKN